MKAAIGEIVRADQRSHVRLSNGLLAPVGPSYSAAVRALDEGLSGVMVSLSFPNVVYVPLSEVAGRMKGVPMDSDTLQTARDLGICCGD